MNTNMKNKNLRIPIGFCPKCSHAVIYAHDPKEKRNVTVRIAEDGYTGKTMLCAKCKTMLVILEKPKVARGYVAVPVVSFR